MSARGLAAELARTFAAVAAPIYVLDGDRKVVYCNRACEAWLGIAPEQLIGQTCSYHSSTMVEPEEQRAAGLCPPPEVFAGERATAVVSYRLNAARIARRQAEFISLKDEVGNCAAVVAIVASDDWMDAAVSAESGLNDRDEAAALHARLAELHAELRNQRRQDRLIGDSPAMARVRAQVEIAAQSRAAVLIVGPLGSGRLHVARAIHYGSPAESLGGADAAIVFHAGSKRAQVDARRAFEQLEQQSFAGRHVAALGR